MFKKALVVSSFILLSSAAYAEGGYIGASVGQTTLDGLGFDKGDSLSFTGGYRMSRGFAAEVSQVDLGKFESSFGGSAISTEVSGLNLSAVGLLPIGDRVDLFGKLGLFMSKTTVNAFGAKGSTDDTALSYGFGAAAHITRNFTVVLESNIYAVDLTNVSLGGRLRF